MPGAPTHRHRRWQAVLAVAPGKIFDDQYAQAPDCATPRRSHRLRARMNKPRYFARNYRIRSRPDL